MLTKLALKNTRKEKITLGNNFLPPGPFEFPVEPETNVARVFFKGQIDMDSKNTNTGLVAFSADEKPAWWIKRRNSQMKLLFLSTAAWACFLVLLFLDTATLLPWNWLTSAGKPLPPPMQSSVFSFHGSWFPSRGLHQTSHTNSFRAWPLWLLLQGENQAKENNKCLNSVPLIRSQSMIIINFINPNKLIPFILTSHTWKFRRRQFK